MRLGLIPAAGGRARTLLANRQDEGTVAWSPDSRTVAAVMGRELGTKRLLLIDVPTATAQTVSSGFEFAGVQFSPDGTQLVFARSAARGRRARPVRRGCARGQRPRPAHPGVDT